jgi:hypothetical protein
MLEKVSFADLVMALTGADRSLKDALLNNLPGHIKHIAEICIDNMEAGKIPAAVIQKGRNMINRALVELSMD